MEITIGDILEGKITGITKFGAFVSFPDGHTGMVHISEIAYSYVSDIKELYKLDQAVKVKVIDIKDGKINLSIKRASEPPQQREPVRKTSGGYQKERQPYSPNMRVTLPEGSASFEDKLKSFMQDSESRISDYKHYIDKKSGARRKR